MIHEHEWNAYLERIKEMAIESAFIAEELKDDNDPEHVIYEARADELFGLLEELQDTLWEVQWFGEGEDPPR
ncbi:MAG: hypothetical protein CL398_11665 [Acidiferrobacteraceae bacterium]|nr:hypothetical protein [Acidiferrobacteraceae bacterium]|tara:strand:+ start:649 stop:864 length:216 start_codon:yes stop_codon:yes gene_type:complete